MTPITVIKRNINGKELWSYEGRVVHRDGDSIILEAFFNGKETEFMGITIHGGDLFRETYFTDRWYNIFAIHDRDTGELKGWYCNIGKPAVLEDEETISYVDLALDLWVATDGTQTLLDEDEFADLAIDPQTREKAKAALEELQEQFHELKKSPQVMNLRRCMEGGEDQEINA